MNTIVGLVVMVVAMSLPLAMAVLVVLWEKRQRRLEGRRSPLAGKRAHLPGEQLRQRIAALGEAIEERLVQLLLVGPLALLVVLFAKVQWTALRFTWLDWGVLAAAFGLCAWNIRKLLPLWRERRSSMDGERAEVAVGQQLSGLQAQECLVLHDIPVEGFNIDHVVVGAAAVYAVETKSRRKAGKGKASANVAYDGKALKFPNWVETRPLEQARAQARWLADYLGGETGEPVPVIPVLCLPGWFVQLEREAQQAEVRVINPKMTGVFFEDGAMRRLQQAQRNRIVHALLKRYPELQD